MTKDVRFSEKKVDSNWKEQTQPDESSQNKESTKTSKAFLNLLSSLGVQVLMQLGEIPNPETKVVEVNLAAAEDILDLLGVMKKKTQGNLSDEEQHFFDSFLPEIQLKFSQKV